MVTNAAAPGLPGFIWVTIEKASELLGLTRQAIYARIKRREWREGSEYQKRGHRVFINMPAVYAWIEQA
ncbi:MAG: excisionase [Stenotrophobium sp.]